MSSVEIIEYTRRDLKRLLADESFWTQPRLPITKRRVLSHISNPRAEDSDTLLITAFDKGRLVAYLGILPDLLMGDPQKPTKFGWLTAWWAAKESQNRLAATMILFAAMKKYSNRVAASFPSSEAIRVYDATKRFQECARLDLSYFMLALPPSFRVVSPLMRWVGGVKNRMIWGRNLQRRRLEIRTVDSLDEALAAFINRWAAEDPLARGDSYWHWILKFPWISASAEDEAAQKRYAFSVFAKDFRQVPVLVRRWHDTIIAFLVMTLRHGRLVLKYAYYEAGDTADVAAALQAVIVGINPWLFVSADAALNTAFEKGFPFYVARRNKTAVIYRAKVLPLLPGSRPQYGIGDIVFT